MKASLGNGLRSRLGSIQTNRVQDWLTDVPGTQASALLFAVDPAHLAKVKWARPQEDFAIATSLVGYWGVHWTTT
jgi:hypothetical protein